MELPGNFFVRLTSPEAAFLRGKFVWVNWDVEEFKGMKDDIVKSELLDIRLKALSFTGCSMSRLAEFSK